MLDLTLFILPCDVSAKHKPELAVESCGKIEHWYVLYDRNLSNFLQTEISIKTKWYGYLYSDEILSPQIKEALPIYLDSGHFDVLVIPKRRPSETETGYRFFQSPRIFRRNIHLVPNQLIPQNPEHLRVERMLDGWIEDNVSNNS